MEVENRLSANLGSQLVACGIKVRERTVGKSIQISSEPKVLLSIERCSKGSCTLELFLALYAASPALNSRHAKLVTSW